MIGFPFSDVMAFKMISKYKNAGNEFKKNAQPIDTQKITFEQAVGGCYYAAEHISDLNEKINYIDEIMKSKNINGIQNILGETTEVNKELGSLNRVFRMVTGNEDYRADNSYPESEKNKKFRKYGNTFFCPKEIREEYNFYPWHFNTLPLGSHAYILQEDFNDALEKIHCLYYNIFLPCKCKADEIMTVKSNRENELYNDYCNIIALNADLLNSTPNERIVNFQKKVLKKIAKITFVIGGATLAATAAFVGIINRSGKDMFTGVPKYRDKWINTATGEKYDYDPG